MATATAMEPKNEMIIFNFIRLICMIIFYLNLFVVEHQLLLNFSTNSGSTFAPTRIRSPNKTTIANYYNVM